jgi:hypothetical protein
MAYRTDSEKFGCVDCGKPLQQSDARQCRRCYRATGGANNFLCNKASPWRTMPDGVLQRFVGDPPREAMYTRAN